MQQYTLARGDTVKQLLLRPRPPLTHCCSTAPFPRKTPSASPAQARTFRRVVCKASLRKVRKPASTVPAPVESLEAASITMISLVSQPAFLLATAIGFSVIAFDVANPASLHILPQYIDQPAHAWVKSYLPPAIKNLVAEKLVSDLFITAGIAGWVAAGIAGVLKSGGPGVKRITIALLFYVFGGGSVRHDPFFVNQLKTHFQRLRPSDILKTYAFPSGHTTAAVFITGTLLCVLLPPLTNANSSAGTRSKLQTVVTSAALPLWGIATVTTATGRVLGDAHWISDTMAGACLGAGLVSLTTVLCNKLAPESR